MYNIKGSLIGVKNLQTSAHVALTRAICVFRCNHGYNTEMKSEYDTLLQFSPLRAGFTSVFAAVTGCVRPSAKAALTQATCIALILKFTRSLEGNSW